MKLTDFIPVVVNSIPINKSKNQVCLFLEQCCITDLHSYTAHCETAVTTDFSPFGPCAFVFSRLTAVLKHTFAEWLVDFRAYLWLDKSIWNFDLILPLPILQEKLQFLLFWSCWDCECIFFSCFPGEVSQWELFRDTLLYKIAGHW